MYPVQLFLELFFFFSLKCWKTDLCAYVYDCKSFAADVLYSKRILTWKLVNNFSLVHSGKYIFFSLFHKSDSKNISCPLFWFNHHFDESIPSVSSVVTNNLETMSKSFE